MAFYDPRVLQVHVLLVDSDMNILLETARMLQFHLYKVTSVKEASVASSMLSNGNTKYDLVMVDVSGSSNLEGFKLVHDAVELGYTVILMSNDADATLVKCAIEDGAFLFMEKRNAAEDFKYLWQHVLREKARKSKEKGTSSGETSTNNQNQNFYPSMGKNLEIGNSSEGMNIMNQYISTTNNVTCQKGRMGHIYVNSDNNVIPGRCMRPKMCTEWTPELHEKFMDAVQKLGDGRCFPKDILELMNVPGLTRMQVASHLQKCRHGWQPPRERQGRCSKASKSSSDSDNSNHPSKTKKYGLFPSLIKGSKSQFPVQDNQNLEQGPNAGDYIMEYSTPANGTNYMGEQLGIWDINVPINTMNEISGENYNDVHGDMVDALEQGLQSDASFEFAAIDNDGLIIANNFDLQNFDYDPTISGQTTDAANQEQDFWSSWIANFARDT